MVSINPLGDINKPISQRIREATQFCIKDLTVTSENNTLTLTGQAASYYYKKISQDCALRFAPCSMSIRNQIEVS